MLVSGIRHIIAQKHGYLTLIKLSQRFLEFFVLLLAKSVESRFVRTNLNEFQSNSCALGLVPDETPHEFLCENESAKLIGPRERRPTVYCLATFKRCFVSLKISCRNFAAFASVDGSL